MTNNSMLMKNELEANRFAAKAMLLTNVFVVLVYILDLMNIFIVEITKMSIAMALSALLLSLPAIVVFILKRQTPWVKYFITFSATLMVCIITTILQFHVIIMFVYPLAISSLYFSRKLSWYTAGFSLITFSVAQLLALDLGIGDKNMTVLFPDTVLYGIAPRAITYLAVAIILIILSKRTAAMLKNVMGAEEQAVMLERMRNVTDKSLEVSNFLVDSVHQLSLVTESTTKANEQIAANTQKIASGAESTLNMMDEASQVVKKISGSMNEIANEGKLIADISCQVRKMTEENGVIMKDAVDEMNTIAEATKQSKEIVARLETRSVEIGQIVEVITGISEQTNMLALNAAIESARAGEQGRGFAVVASQIRALAEQSQQAAKDIANLIQEVMEDTHKAAEAMDKGSSLVDKGVVVVRNAGTSFEKVATAGAQMNDKIQNVSKSTQDVAESSEKIVDIVSNIKSINSKNLGELQEIAAATEEQLASMEEVASSV
ncbi:MAG: methyl-accepting chemotaxis protein, partial [Clostridia bacterium]|nr:methyl-accepting chemotaxis protein [Clostridia bacterium]